MHKENWDDLRFVLSVAQNGSVSAAARELGVNHATVLRRIASFEDRHGSQIFDKTARGYLVPEDRARVIDAAREVENAILAVERMIGGAQAPLSGVVRVTSTDTFCMGVLPQMLAGLRDVSSDLHIDLLSSNAHLDLGRLDADITVRPTLKLPDDLVGETSAKLGFAAYAAPDAPDLWLGLSGALQGSRPGQWLAKIKPEAQMAGTADSFLTLQQMAAAGLGRAILPCFLAETDPRLTRQDFRLPDLSVDIWVASHSDLATIPRIRAVREHLLDQMAAQADRLAGL